MKTARKGRPMGPARTGVEMRLREAMSARGIPGYSELAEAAGVSRVTINQMCASGTAARDTFRRLARELYCDPDWLENGRQRQTGQTPVLGQIAAGRPIWNGDERDEEESLDLQQLFGRGQTFSLRVRGTSMIDAGILDGTLVVARADEPWSPGDICVCQIGDHATVKRVYDDGDTWRLVPENPNFPTENFAKDGDVPVRICGKVIGWVHQL